MKNGKLENKIWWFIYNQVGVHPDDYSIDWSTPETVEKSLQDADLGDWEVPKEWTGPEMSFTRFCMEAAKNSILVDKKFAFRCAMFSREVRELWENGDPADAPQVDNEVMIQAQKLGSKFVVK
jgi:hypothetical protein